MIPRNFHFLSVISIFLSFYWIGRFFNHHKWSFLTSIQKKYWLWLRMSFFKVFLAATIMIFLVSQWISLWKPLFIKMEKLREVSSRVSNLTNAILIGGHFPIYTYQMIIQKIYCCIIWNALIITLPDKYSFDKGFYIW